MSSDLLQRLETMVCISLFFPTEAYGAATQACVAAMQVDDAAESAYLPQLKGILLHSDSIVLQQNKLELQQCILTLQQNFQASRGDEAQ